MNRLMMTVMTMMIAVSVTAGNLVQNGDFTSDNLGGLVNWTCIRPQTDAFEILDECGPDGGHALRLHLSAKGGLHQPGFKYVDNEPYRMTAWVRTKNLRPGNATLIAYDDWLHLSSKSEPLPTDTDGKWVKLVWDCEKMFVNIKKARCYYGVQVVQAMKPDEILEIADLTLEPLSEKAVANTISPRPAKPFVPRIVPIDPKLTEVDLAKPEMLFYYPGDLRTNGELVAFVDGREAARGTLDAERRVRLNLGSLKEGRHRLEVRMLDDGKEVARNEYVITVRPHATGAQAGRRLNNLVTELPVEREAYGHYFEAPRKGWYFMSCDNPAAEKMEFLDAGRHKVPLPAIHGAKVTVRAIRQIEIGGESNLLRSTDIGQYVYGADFVDRYLVPSMNTMSMWEWERKKHAEAMKFFEARDIAQTYSLSLNSGSPVWGDAKALAAAITNCNGYLDRMLLSMDETAIERPRLVQNAIAEALWSLADVPDLHIGIFYNDAMRRVFTDKRISPSVLAAIANCGAGTGKVRVEAYSAALASEAETKRKSVDYYPQFQASVERMAPCAADAVLYHVSGYISPYLWCDYPASTADFKVFFADLIRSYATDPVFREINGISFDAIMRIDEELLRWMSKVFRYYGIEGHTDDLCAKYGYRYIPGLLQNGDFARGLEGWEVDSAAEGSIRMDHMKGFGEDVLCFRECGPNYGDDFVVMKRDATRPNVLRQTARGLKSGQLYFFSCVTLDLADVKSPGAVIGPTHFRVNVKGAQVIDETRFRQEFCTGKREGRRTYRRGPCEGRVTDRFVFRAEGETATFELSDWDTKTTPGGQIGGETIVTYIICRPYYVESEDEFKELVTRWPTNK